MSKLFFDGFADFEKIESTIKSIVSTTEELDEIRGIVDEIINYQATEKILGKIPEESHEEFLALFHKCPHDEVTIFKFINGKAGRDIKEELKEDFRTISSDILHELRPEEEVSRETKVPVK